MKVAVASSGLGHVARGIEAWARDTACALAERGADVTLFAGGAVNSAAPGAAAAPVLTIHCLRRGEPSARRLAALTPKFAWRPGLKSAYGWEQLTFWLRLWPRLRAGRFDILHVQDPMLAHWCRAFRRAGLVRTREILAHGTEEPAGFLARFPRVQHLAPWHMEKALADLGESPADRPLWVAIPNFVDTLAFSPGSAEGRVRARARLGIAADAFVVGCVAAVKSHHKRIDYLIREFAAYEDDVRRGAASSPGGGKPALVIAGARTPESDGLAAMARELIGEQARVYLDVDRNAMPDVYRAFDVMVLPSLFEMMPIALIEAMACGVPTVANAHSVLSWIAGADDASVEAGGIRADLSGDGALRVALAGLSPERLRRLAAGARARATGLFAKEIVMDRVAGYYRRAVADGRAGS